MTAHMKVYTPEEVAEILQVSKNLIYELIASHELYAKKIGRVYRIPAAAIDYYTHNMDYHQLVAQVRERGVHPNVVIQHIQNDD